MNGLFQRLAMSAVTHTLFGLCMAAVTAGYLTHNQAITLDGDLTSALPILLAGYLEWSKHQKQINAELEAMQAKAALNGQAAGSASTAN